MKTKIVILLLVSAVGISSAQTSGTLTISTLTSQTIGEAYAPANILAMWITNNSGTFIKSTLKYASERQEYLYTWITQDPTLNVVDATTGATQNSHGTRTSSWNGKNVNEVVVPDGSYTVHMELTDKHSQGNLGTFAFTKGPVAQTLTPTAVPSFANISIKWTPVTTGLEDVAFSSLYSVYPNPTTASIFVSGLGIQKIEICNIIGKSILTSDEQNINLSALSKGVYFVVIRTVNGTAVKKIEKL